MGQKKDDTIKTDGRQDNERAETQQLNKTKRAFLLRCMSSWWGARTTQETKKRPEAKGKKKSTNYHNNKTKQSKSSQKQTKLERRVTQPTQSGRAREGVPSTPQGTGQHSNHNNNKKHEQIQPRTPVLDDAEYTALIRQNELDHTDPTDQTSICPGGSRS